LLPPSNLDSWFPSKKDKILQHLPRMAPMESAEMEKMFS